MSSFLTIGMATADDFHGSYFSIHDVRKDYPDLMGEIDFVVIDNKPSQDKASHSHALRDTCSHIRNIQYVAFSDYQSTSVRNEIFRRAKGEFVMSIDCHVLFWKNSLYQLFEYLKAHRQAPHLYQGPMIYDNHHMASCSTQFDPVWRDEMFGTWGTAQHWPLACAGLQPWETPAIEPFDIPSQGLGLFLCRRDAWLGFNPLFRGFGGEEGYIHEKFRKAGRRTICLPFLVWQHRFQRPGGTPYPLTADDKIRNYFLGWYELGLPEEQIIEHFRERGHGLPRLLEIQKQAHQEWDSFVAGQSAPAVKSFADTSQLPTAQTYEVAQRMASAMRKMSQQQRGDYMRKLAELNEPMSVLVQHYISKGAAA